MAPDFKEYIEQVKFIEGHLAPYAKRSIEPFSPKFVDGSEVYRYFSNEWANRPSRLTKRTPLQIERDKILYSHGMRKLTEKYHILYSGRSRIVRNFLTHTMKAQQVARAACRGLDLNSDFAEALALGSKIGSLPFVHASKHSVSEWLDGKLRKIDQEHLKADPRTKVSNQGQLLFDLDSPLPLWLQKLTSVRTVESAKKFIPWAAGKGVESLYSSGQQGYWQLCTNPYSLECVAKAFSPETMFGIWRHTLGLPVGANTFHHKCELEGATPSNEIHWRDITYEAIIVQYADDITWVIENLNDANNAALLGGRESIYPVAVSYLKKSDGKALISAVQDENASAIYTYFINDLVDNSLRQLKCMKDEALKNREALRAGKVEAARIGLSDEAEQHLRGLKRFLDEKVFDEPRVRNRTRMLKNISEACVDLLFESQDGMRDHIETRSKLERWDVDTRKKALDLLDDEIHRLQLSVDIFSSMGDQEIYDLVGVQAL